MTLKELTNKLIGMYDNVKEDDHIKTRDGRILKDIYVDGYDNVIIEVEK